MKIIHASDLHNDRTNLETIVNAAKQDNAVFAFTGDWFDCDEGAQEALLKYNILSEDLAKKLIKNTEESKDSMMRQITKGMYTNEEADEIIKGLEKLPEHEEAQKYIQEMASESYEFFNKSIEGVKTLITPGNHDMKTIYDIVTNGHFVDKESIEIEGIKFAGGINTYELPRGIKQDYLVDFDDDVPIEYVHQMLAQQGLIKEGMKEEEINEILKKAVEQIGKSTPIYQKLKDEKIDYLMTHKGPYGIMTRQGKQVIGTGVGTTVLAEEKNPHSLCGHFHGEEDGNIGGSYGLRATPNTFYTIEMDQESKKIQYIDVYEFEKTA